MIGWRHAFAGAGPTATHAFAASDEFTVTGAPIAKNSAVIEAGLDFAINSNVTLGVSYTGQFGSGAHENGAKAHFSVKF
jgi:outer membrane autotransporter protein